MGTRIERERDDGKGPQVVTEKGMEGIDREAKKEAAKATNERSRGEALIRLPWILKAVLGLVRWTDSVRKLVERAFLSFLASVMQDCLTRLEAASGLSIIFPIMSQICSPVNFQLVLPHPIARRWRKQKADRA